MKPSASTPAAVLFDLDGTLIDTAAEFVIALDQLRAEHQLLPLAPERVRASVSNGAAALVTLGLGLAASDPGFESARQRLLVLYTDVLGTQALPYPGIPELLQQLQAAGIPWGIATNKPRQYTEPLLARLNLQPAPGSVVCPDDVEQRKPHPESLLRNCHELGCEASASVYIGDHLRDISAGQRAGMLTIAAAWGYIEPGDDPRSWGADLLAGQATELAPMLGLQTKESTP